MKAKVAWAKPVWEVFEELSKKRNLPRLWNAWIPSDTSLTDIPAHARPVSPPSFSSGRQLARIP